MITLGLDPVSPTSPGHTCERCPRVRVGHHGTRRYLVAAVRPADPRRAGGAHGPRRSPDFRWPSDRCGSRGGLTPPARQIAANRLGRGHTVMKLWPGWGRSATVWSAPSSGVSELSSRPQKDAYRGSQPEQGRGLVVLLW
jgi:hypothetical protein